MDAFSTFSPSLRDLVTLALRKWRQRQLIVLPATSVFRLGSFFARRVGAPGGPPAWLSPRQAARPAGRRPARTPRRAEIGPNRGRT